MWLLAAAGSALFAGVTAVLAKLGIRRTDPDVATAIRTVVVLAFAWLMAALMGQAGGTRLHRRHVVGLPRALGRSHRCELDLLLQGALDG